MSAYRDPPRGFQPQPDNDTDPHRRWILENDWPYEEMDWDEGRREPRRLAWRVDGVLVTTVMGIADGCFVDLPAVRGHRQIAISVAGASGMAEWRYKDGRWYYGGILPPPKSAASRATIEARVRELIAAHADVAELAS